MGTPIKVDVNGQPVFICCAGCRTSLLKDPEKYLAKLQKHDQDAGTRSHQEMKVPPIDEPVLLEPQDVDSSDAADGSGARAPGAADGDKDLSAEETR